MPGAGIGWGLAAALSFGVGDFSGALAARRSRALPVVAGAQLVGLAALVVAMLVLRPAIPDAGTLAIAALAGAAGVVGLGALFRGMTLGSMGLVASLSGAGSLALPVLATPVFGGSMSGLQLAGVGCAAAAAAVAGGSSHRGAAGRALLFAAVAAVAFGAWYVLLDLAAAEGDLLWTLLVSRASASLLAAVVAVRAGTGLPPRRLVALTGLADVGGNAFFVLAADTLAVGIAAALTGLYPVVTLVLARILLGERLSALAMVAIGLALGAVLLISLGR